MQSKHRYVVAVTQKELRMSNSVWRNLSPARSMSKTMALQPSQLDHFPATYTAHAHPTDCAEEPKPTWNLSM